MPYTRVFSIHTFAAQHVDRLRCAWKLVFAGPEHAYPSRIISLSFPISFIFVFFVGKSIDPSRVGMRTIAVEEEHLQAVSIWAFREVYSS